MSEVMEEAGVTAGGLLRQTREAAGVHIAALAVALKVPVSKLEALEADDYDALPDTVFVRALASSVCRTLKLDPVTVLSLLPQSKSPQLASDRAGLNAPVKGSPGKSASSANAFSSRSTSMSVTFIVLALLVGALVLVFFPREPDDAKGSSGTPTSGTSPSGTVFEQASIGLANDVQSTGPLAVSPSPGSGAVERNEVAQAPGAPTAAPPASAPIATASAVSPVAGVLVLRARSESWVQVRDATGGLALQRNLAAGESVSIAGPAPLAVVVGRADVTEVLVRGKPFDLTAVSRENVARFEVK